MTPNELLLWLSARGQGTWPQFRGAVEALDIENPGENPKVSGFRFTFGSVSTWSGLAMLNSTQPDARTAGA